MFYRAKSAARMGVAKLKEFLGAENLYGIRGAYRHRTEYAYYDDTENSDEWQREVYETAANLVAKEQLRTVCDVGCGSAFKLIHYLGQYETVGFDVPETVEFLRREYPSRRWEVSDLGNPKSAEKFDLVICADVIEHVLEPDKLLAFIKASARKWVILSTPDRDLVYHKHSPFHLGPPRNHCHIREWSFKELERFVGVYFDIAEHTISNREQWTQMIVARPQTIHAGQILPPATPRNCR